LYRVHEPGAGRLLGERSVQSGVYVVNLVLSPTRFWNFARGRRLLAGLLATVAVVLALGAASPTTGGGLLAELHPQSAQAYQGGWDSDHWWISVTRGEVASGVVTFACAYFVRIPVKPLKSYVCSWLSATAKRVVGAAQGFWAVIYPPRGWHFPYVRVGTW
jgi:hypothetical protein